MEMTDERFERWNDHSCTVKDNREDNIFLNWEDVVNKLNEQQSTIQSLQREIEELGISIKLFEDDIATKDKKISEQQATICKLQDLCGKSDYENAKLRLKNKELQEEIKLLKPTNVEQYEQIVQLQEENEQLRKQVESSETTSNATSHYNAFLESKINTLEEENERLKKEKEGWKLSTCQYMNKDSVLMIDCQIVHEALFELERLIEADTEQMERFNDLKDKFKSLVNCFYEIHDSARNVDILCERLNGLVEENERLKQKLENIGLNAKNDAVKMIDGKFFIRM